MPGMNGRSVLIEKGGTSLAASLRTKTITFNGEPTNVTTVEDAGWITKLDGVFNSNSVTVQLEGVLKDDTLTDMAFTGAQDTFTLTIGDLFTLTGTWQFQSGASIGAPHDGETTISGTLESSGEIVKAEIV